MNRKLDAEAYCNRSGDSYDSDKFDQSVIFCKRALTIKSNDSEAHFLWGSSLNGKEDYDRSIRKHKEIVRRNPKDYRGFNNFGLALENENKLLEAEIRYRKSIAINPSAKESSFGLAVVLTKQGRYREAGEQYWTDLRGRDEKHTAQNYNCYGYLKFLLGKYEEAIKNFEEAISRDSEESLHFLNKSIAFYCLGESELALEVFQKTLDKFASSHNRLQESLLIYIRELNRSKELFESGDLGEINREQLIINIKGLQFIIDLLKQELAKFR